MSTQERIHRDVVIANRTYPLKIYKNDEEKILSIVKSVNHKIEQLKLAYDAKDNQDFLAMCILQMYTQQVMTSPNTTISSPELNLEPQLAKIETLLQSVSFE